MTKTTQSRRRLTLASAAVIVGFVGAAGCSGDQSSTTDSSTSVESTGNDAVRLVDVDAFATVLEESSEAPVINVHIPYEGHIDGTDHFVAFDEIADWDGLPADLDAPIVLYCRSGNMSGAASQTLADMGYTDITDLDGGMNAWTAAGNRLLDEEPSDV